MANTITIQRLKVTDIDSGESRLEVRVNDDYASWVSDYHFVDEIPRDDQALLEELADIASKDGGLNDILSQGETFKGVNIGPNSYDHETFNKMWLKAEEDAEEERNQ